MRSTCIRGGGLSSAATAASVALSFPVAAYAQAETFSFDIPAQSVGSALRAFAQTTRQQVTFDEGVVRGRNAPALRGQFRADQAIQRLLEGTGLSVQRGRSGVFIVRDLAAAAPPPVDAGTQVASTDPDGQEIIVTGTNIRGGASASETITIDRREIERSGLATTQQLLDRLPQQFSGSATENTNGGINGGEQSGFNVSAGAGLDLRGLGPDSTLVLINGRRIASTGIGNFVDISLIPLSAIERIEIVADGASAIYGSDAVGGVANFILRSDFEGAETRARFGTVTEGDAREYQLGQLVGATWESGSVLASYEFYKRGRLDANDRSFTEDAEDPFDLLPRQQRHSAFVTLRHAVSPGVEVFADALYANRKSEGRFSYFGFSSVGGADTEQFGFTAGSRINLPSDWQVELRGTYDRNSTDQIAIASSDFKGNMWSADVRADGSVFHLGGGDARIAIGGQFRRESFRRGQGDVQDRDSRKVLAAFGEVFLPFFGEENEAPGLHRLEFTAAVRVEDYSDFGSTFNPKVGVLWSPVRGLRFRSTYGSSFKAPLLYELSETTGQIIPQPLLDPSSPLGFTNAIVVLGGNPDLGPEKAKNFSAGLDFSPANLPSLDLSLTFFKVDFKDRIASPPLDLLFNVGFGSPLLEPFFTRDISLDVVREYASRPNFINFLEIPLNEITAVADFRATNLARTRVKGLDASASYFFVTPAGRFDLAANASYLFDHKRQIVPGGEFTELVGTRFNPVDFRANGSVGWSSGGWTATAFVNYVDSYSDNSVPGVVEGIDSWTTLDLALMYDTGNSVAPALRNLKVGLSVLNLFDNDPPFVQSDVGLNFDATNANALGRFVAFEVVKRW